MEGDFLIAQMISLKKKKEIRQFFSSNFEEKIRNLYGKAQISTFSGIKIKEILPTICFKLEGDKK